MKQRLVAGFLVGLVAVVIAVPSALANHAQFYVLDGFGGVHAGGGAPAISPGTPYFGFDIAKGIVFVAQATGASVGDSVLVLDGFGGIHEGGALAADPVAPKTPYFGFNIARAITYRNIPPRVAGAAAANIVDLTTASSTFTVLETTSIFAPDDGFLFVVGSSYMSCATIAQTDNLGGQLSINVDATTEPAAIAEIGIATFPDCTYASGGSLYQTDNQTVSHLFPVSAGAHTVNLLGRKRGGTATTPLRFLGRSLSVLFIDQDSSGVSSVFTPVPPGATGPVR